MRWWEHSPADCGKGSSSVSQEPEAGVLCAPPEVTVDGERNMSITVCVNHIRSTAEFVS